MDILFEAESRDVDPVAIVADRRKLSEETDPVVAPVADYTEAIISGVAVELDTLDVLLDEHIAETWTLGRLPSVDRAILRVAAWEMIFNTEVPVTTAVVEAVEIASEYSTDNSSAYINATLDSMATGIGALRERARNPQAAPSDEQAPAPWDDSVALDDADPGLSPAEDAGAGESSGEL